MTVAVCPARWSDPKPTGNRFEMIRLVPKQDSPFTGTKTRAHSRTTPKNRPRKHPPRATSASAVPITMEQQDRFRSPRRIPAGNIHLSTLRSLKSEIPLTADSAAPGIAIRSQSPAAAFRCKEPRFGPYTEIILPDNSRNHGVNQDKSNVTTVIPAPPRSACSSAALTISGTVRR